MIEAPNLSGLSLQDLRVLVEVSRAGSVSAASESIGVSQPTASYALDKARRVFNDPIFVRVGRSMRGTPFGEGLISYLDRALLDLQQLTAPEEFRPAETDRIFRVVGLVGELISPTGRFCDLLLDEAPNIGLHTASFMIPNVDNHLRQDFDIYLGPAKPPSAGIRTYPLGDFQMLSFFDGKAGPPPDQVDDFLERDFIQICDLLAWGGIVDEVILANWGAKRRYRFQVSTFPQIAQLVRGTSRVSTFSALLTWSAIGELDCVPLPFDAPRLTYEIRWCERLDKDPAHIWFREWLMDFFKDVPQTWEEVVQGASVFAQGVERPHLGSF